jgi:hypothetical protein
MHETRAQQRHGCELVGFAGFGAGITTDCEPLRAMIRSCYGGFPAASVSFSLEAVVSVDESATPASREVEITRKGDVVLLSSEMFSAEIDIRKRSGLIRQPCAVYPIDACLRAAYTALHTEHGGFLLHASGVVRDNLAYVFIGHSGSGKSTIVERMGGIVLADEILALRATPKGFFAAGTPYWIGTNISAPIGGLFALRQAEVTELVPRSSAEMARLVVQSVCTMGMDTDGRASLFRSCRALVESVPCGELRFSLGAEATWRAIGFAARQSPRAETPWA